MPYMTEQHIEEAFASLVFKTTDEEFIKQFKIVDYSPLSDAKGKTRIAAISLAQRAFYLGVRYAEENQK